MGLLVEIGVAKVNKYASRESGDTVEVVERPLGGVTAVLADGQGSGAGAKALSLMLTAKAVALIKEGVRDGAVARAMHDILFAARGGKVSASIDLVTVDLWKSTVLLTRNSASPAIVVTEDRVEVVAGEAGAIGTAAFVRPKVHSFPLTERTSVWVVSDGISGAGKKFGTPPLDLPAVCGQQAIAALGAQERADRLLSLALASDRGRPADDMTVIALVAHNDEASDGVRRMHIALPVERHGRGG